MSLIQQLDNRMRELGYVQKSGAYEQWDGERLRRVAVVDNILEIEVIDRSNEDGNRLRMRKLTRDNILQLS